MASKSEYLKKYLKSRVPQRPKKAPLGGGGLKLGSDDEVDMCMGPNRGRPGPGAPGKRTLFQVLRKAADGDKFLFEDEGAEELPESDQEEVRVVGEDGQTLELSEEDKRKVAELIAKEEGWGGQASRRRLGTPGPSSRGSVTSLGLPQDGPGGGECQEKFDSRQPPSVQEGSLASAAGPHTSRREGENSKNSCASHLRGPSQDRSPSIRKPDDLPPPIRGRNDSLPSPSRREAQSGDLSPPRRRGGKNLSALEIRGDKDQLSHPREGEQGEQDRDLSPPRRGRGGDMSPRRRERDRDLSPPRKEGDGNISSPTRGKADNELTSRLGRGVQGIDLSPSRTEQARCIPPPRRLRGSPFCQRGAREDSYYHVVSKGPEKMHELGRVPEGSPEGLSKAISTADRDPSPRRHGANPGGRSAALRASGEGASASTRVVFRDREGRVISEEEWLALEGAKGKKRRREGRGPAPILEWGSGLKQREERNAKRREEEELAKQPFARYEIDADYDADLRARDRWADPIAMTPSCREISRGEKQVEEVTTECEEKQKRPQCPHDGPPNRFGIKPGYRWDGVVRGNGFEEERIKAMHRRRWEAEVAHMNNTADM